VLTLWAAVVAERLGHHEETTLTLGGATERAWRGPSGRR
jgi:hypothetical protein